MRIDDFFAPTVLDVWKEPVDEPRMDVIRDLAVGPIQNDDDLETAISLTRLVHAEFEEFGTDQKRMRLDNDQIAVAYQSLRSALSRYGITFALPWRDYKTFRSHWIGQGASGDGGWHKRRAILSGYFEPVFSALDRMEAARFGNTVAEAVSPAGRTGWQQVDACIDDVMVRFRSATSPADYQDVGRRSVALVEALSETVYVPVIHKRDGETEPPIAKTHLRIGRFIEDSLHGSGNAEARSLVRKTAEFAEAVKHRPTSTRRDAGIVADAVILLAHLLRRIDSA